MLEPSSHLHRESAIFLARARQQSRAHNFISEEEYYTQPEKTNTPGIRDAVILTLGDWLIKLGEQLRTRSAYARPFEKQV